MSIRGVTFTAACPACGVDCTWTGYYSEQPPYRVASSCPCEGVQAAEPVEVEEVIPNTPATAPRQADAACAHGRGAGCLVCREDAEAA